MLRPSPTLGALRSPIVDKNGNASRDFEKLMNEFQSKLAALTIGAQIAKGTAIVGRTEGIETTVANLTNTGAFSSLDKVADGTLYGKTFQTALTSGAVDLSKAGVVGLLGSTKMKSNVGLNVTNNATVDSIDAGASVTVRVYGTGGVGSSWIAYKGSAQTVMLAGTVTGLLYNTVYYVYWDGTAFQASTDAFSPLADGNVFAGRVTSVANAASVSASATAVLAATGVASVTITNVGAGYGSAPSVSFSGGSGSGAAGTAVLTGATVTSVTMTNAGSGYTSSPTVSFSGGGGAGAAGSAVLVPSFVSQINVTAGGSGYASAPAVSMSGGGGAGATAVAIISGGAVTSVAIGATGSGYTSAPAVAFGGGQVGISGGGTVTGAGANYGGGGRLPL